MQDQMWTYNILERRADGVICGAPFPTLDAAIAEADRLQAVADLDAPTSADGRATSTYIIYYFLTACYETRPIR